MFSNEDANKKVVEEQQYGIIMAITRGENLM